MGTGNILVEGVNTFAGVFTRLREITKEFIPYFIRIVNGILGIQVLRLAVKNIMRYLEGKSKGTFYDRRARREYGYRGKEKRTRRDDKELDDAIKYGR